ncbi:nitroreductase family protein [Solibacillus isronensis]|uniref:nitroreductase family protein n=1 Tax=Solibacillus isronensis TaxID=412383 RepID=UPI0020409365|nr:nitroreductase family protein [Solibacillus isronensis]MCM3723424.1 nitroreductase family protein [Solibacillus isronensis]
MSQQKSALEKLMDERKSVRKYESGVAIPRETIQHILQQATTAPSSSNLQPWRFLVIDDQEQKKELRIAGFNQEQIETSSAIIAVIGDIEMYKNAKQINDLNVELGYMPREIADMMISNSEASYSNFSDAERSNIAHLDSGLISMQIVLLAKDMGYDTVIMGGFDKAAFAKRYELPANEVPMILIAIGKAAMPARNSSRLPFEQIIRFSS